MIIEFQCVTVSQSCSLGQSDTAGTFPTLPVSILNRHYLIRKVALVHVKVEAVHGD